MEYSVYSQEIIDIVERMQEKITGDIVSLQTIHEQLFETFFFDLGSPGNRLIKMKKLSFQMRMNEHFYWKNIEYSVVIGIEQLCDFLEKKEGFRRKECLKKEWVVGEILYNIGIHEGSLYSLLYHDRYSYQDFLKQSIQTDGKKSTAHFSVFYEILVHAYGDTHLIPLASQRIHNLIELIDERTHRYMRQRERYIREMNQLDKHTQNDLLLYAMLEEVLGKR